MEVLGSRVLGQALMESCVLHQKSLADLAVHGATDFFFFLFFLYFTTLEIA